MEGEMKGLTYTIIKRAFFSYHRAKLFIYCGLAASKFMIMKPRWIQKQENASASPKILFGSYLELKYKLRNVYERMESGIERDFFIDF